MLRLDTDDNFRTMTETSGPLAFEPAWSCYLAKEANGARSEKLAALDEFIADIRCRSRSEQIAFVEWFCRQHLDGAAPSDISLGNGQWMRLPLFREVFADILEEGRSERRPNYSRWMAQFHSLFGHRHAPYRHYEPNKQILLAEALDRDPTDNRARAMLVFVLLDWLDYACHELPHGLLCEPNDLQVMADRLQAHFVGTLWEKRARTGSSALRRVASGDWSNDTLVDVEDMLMLRFTIDRSLFPHTKAIPPR